MDTRKIESELGWRPGHGFGAGLRATVRWYLDNKDWWEAILKDGYHAERLGLTRDSRGAGRVKRSAGDAA